MKNRKLEILWEKNLSLIRCQETEDKTHFVKKFLNIVSYYIPKFKHPHQKIFVFVPRLIFTIRRLQCFLFIVGYNTKKLLFKEAELFASIIFFEFPNRPCRVKKIFQKTLILDFESNSAVQPLVHTYVIFCAIFPFYPNHCGFFAILQV